MTAGLGGSLPSCFCDQWSEGRPGVGWLDVSGISTGRPAQGRARGKSAPVTPPCWWVVVGGLGRPGRWFQRAARLRPVVCPPSRWGGLTTGTNGREDGRGLGLMPQIALPTAPTMKEGGGLLPNPGMCFGQILSSPWPSRRWPATSL